MLEKGPPAAMAEKYYFKFMMIIIFLFGMGIDQLVKANPIAATVLEKSEVLPPVEWFGGPRGGDSNEAFYDLFYDENICPTGLRSSAVKNFAYVGSIMKTTKNNNGTEDCVRQCFSTPDCKSINIYLKKKYLCELNSNDQFDDPLKLISKKDVIYYDRIQCTIIDQS